MRRCGTWAKHAGVPLRRVRAVEGAGRPFSTSSRPAGARATEEPASPSTQVGRARPPEKGRPVSDRRRTGRRLVALPPGRLADLLVAIPASLTLILEPVLASPTTTRTP